MQTSSTTGGRIARRLAAALLALSATALAGCGFDAQTNQIYQPAVGADARSGTVDVLAAVIVSPKVGQGAFLATLVDNSDTTGDQLTSITAGSGVKVADAPKLTLPKQTPVDLADAGGIEMTGDAISNVDSSYVELTLNFANSDAVTINVPVVTATGPYAGFGSAPKAPNSVAANGAKGKGNVGAGSPGGAGAALPTPSPTSQAGS